MEDPVDFNKQQREMNDRHNLERREQSDRHNLERRTLNDRQNLERNKFQETRRVAEGHSTPKKRNALMGAILGLVISATVTYYVVQAPGWVETCERDDSGEWPVGICVLTHPQSTSKELIIFNPGALEKETFLRSIGGKSHEAFLKLFKPEEAPKIVTFTLYPNAQEKSESDLDQEKYGSLVVYSKDKKDFVSLAMSKLQAKYGEGSNGYVLVGTSRGGWNSLQEVKWLLDSGGNLPRKLLLISPMMADWNPITGQPPAPPIPWWKIMAAIATQNYMLLINIDFFASGVDSLFEGAYKTNEAWLEANPFEWSDEIVAKLPPIMIQSTPTDKFPFFKPNKALAEKWKAQFIQTVGEHATWYAPKAKEFISQ